MKRIILKSALIVDPQSAFHQQRKDILIENGSIQKIEDSISTNADDHVVTSENLHVSPGWCDMNTVFGDPGLEFREDLATGSAAAAAGGFTAVAILPNTQPAIHSKSEVNYILQQGDKHGIDIYPVGAITMDCAGKDITEIYDMQSNGAIAFSDGFHPLQDAGLLERSLMYVKPFDGLVMHHPEDRSISLDGMMNEGNVSVGLGVPASPALAEELAVSRDIYLARYTASRLHLLNISAATSVALVREAKKAGTLISAGVNAANLMLTDTDLVGFDPNYKINPPLRSEEDRNHLIDGVLNGDIDVISSGHRPVEIESKACEFDHADFGMIGLETAFAVANTAMGDKSNAEVLVKALCHNPRKLLRLECPQVAADQAANLTIFDPEKPWEVKTEDIRSKSHNSPFIGRTLTGKVFGVINGTFNTLN